MGEKEPADETPSPEPKKPQENYRKKLQAKFRARMAKKKAAPKKKK